jgi:hypothetical protein
LGGLRRALRTLEGLMEDYGKHPTAYIPTISLRTFRRRSRRQSRNGRKKKPGKRLKGSFIGSIIEGGYQAGRPRSTPSNLSLQNKADADTRACVQTCYKVFCILLALVASHHNLLTTSQDQVVLKMFADKTSRLKLLINLIGPLQNIPSPSTIAHRGCETQRQTLQLKLWINPIGAL